VRLRREARWLGVIAALAVVAIACGAYLLSNERLASPFGSSYSIDVAFAGVDAVAPGLGEPVNVAGVRVGQIGGVTLRNGHGVLHLLIDPGKLPRLTAGTRAALVPNTPLKDMQVDLRPGRADAPPLADGATIALAQTTTPIDSDELLHALDGDTREYLRLLIADVGVGLHGRGPQLRGLLRSLGPTTAQVQRIAALLASRRHELPALVHDLATLTKAAGGRDAAITRIVQAGNATLQATASQDGALRSSLAQLPGTLTAARRTLVRAAPFARSLRRTLVALEPAVPRLRATLASAPDAVRGLLPLPIGPLRRFTRAIGPIGPSVSSASADLGAALAPLTTAFKMLGASTNMLGYNPSGGPHGYLFWLDWFFHNSNSMLSTEDAHGAVWRGLALMSCSSLSASGQAGTALKTLLGGASACP
jgi:phospholipid/cholesterol/gamma-HCH transport system substrate-binding protein